MTLLQDYAARQAESRPDAVALVMGDERLTYGELDAAANRLARLLREAGCKRGDRVCLFVPKCPACLAAHVALWTRDLDVIAGFWSTFFGAEVGEVYESRRRPGFRSRFLTLGSGPAIEIMEGPWVTPGDPKEEHTGLAHVALSLGSEQAVGIWIGHYRDQSFTRQRARGRCHGFAR